MEGRNLMEKILSGLQKPTNLPLALLYEVIENFSEKRKIGVGGFGEVYKGMLQNRGVAVKRIIVSEHTIDDKLFDREVKNLMKNISHRNVVRFIGFCSNTHHELMKAGPEELVKAQIRERLLCFEYISNGSLDKHITDELRGLEWSIRFEIIKGICHGLNYLHDENNIVHMDLKPGNIMLDDDMVPKITDFGLSRLDTNTHTSGVRFITRGYCAPEYENSGKTSKKADMYSLGVLIVELVMGCKGPPNNEQVLRRWIHRWSKSMKDTQLGYAQVTKCIEIGLLCQEKDPTKRPSICDVIKDLNQTEGSNVQSSNAIESLFDQIIPYSKDDMLGIEPLELHFTFEHNRKISSSFQLTNETDACIAFNVQIMSILPYYTVPNKGIVPPQSKCSVEITLQPQEKVPQHHDDKFIVRSTKVTTGLVAENITSDMFKKKMGNLVDKINKWCSGL
uniref:Uncharacterized protein n=1 Tax=Avena sativa TaxID=4498 RepID=A0ACD6AAQ5_AVESA